MVRRKWATVQLLRYRLLVEGMHAFHAHRPQFQALAATVADLTMHDFPPLRRLAGRIVCALVRVHPEAMGGFVRRLCDGDLRRHHLFVPACRLLAMP